MVWFEDKQIAGELVNMKGLRSEERATPLPVTTSPNKVINAAYDGRQWRRYPEAHRLNAEWEEPPL